MKQLNPKKLILLNLPYVLLGLYATKLGQACLWQASEADWAASVLVYFIKRCES